MSSASTLTRDTFNTFDFFGLRHLCHLRHLRFLRPIVFVRRTGTPARLLFRSSVNDSALKNATAEGGHATDAISSISLNTLNSALARAASWYSQTAVLSGTAPASFHPTSKNAPHVINSTPHCPLSIVHCQFSHPSHSQAPRPPESTQIPEPPAIRNQSKPHRRPRTGIHRGTDSLRYFPSASRLKASGRHTWLRARCHRIRRRQPMLFRIPQSRPALAQPVAPQAEAFDDTLRIDFSNRSDAILSLENQSSTTNHVSHPPVLQELRQCLRFIAVEIRSSVLSNEAWKQPTGGLASPQTQRRVTPRVTREEFENRSERYCR